MGNFICEPISSRTPNSHPFSTSLPNSIWERTCGCNSIARGRGVGGFDHRPWAHAKVAWAIFAKRTPFPPRHPGGLPRRWAAQKASPATAGLPGEEADGKRGGRSMGEQGARRQSRAIERMRESQPQVARRVASEDASNPT